MNKKENESELIKRYKEEIKRLQIENTELKRRLDAEERLSNLLGAKLDESAGRMMNK